MLLFDPQEKQGDMAQALELVFCCRGRASGGHHVTLVLLTE